MGDLQSGESLPDHGLAIELYGRELTLHCDAMVAADETHRAELVLVDHLRRRRRDLTVRLKQKFLALRSLFGGLFGESSLALLALDFKLAQTAAGVVRQAEIVRDRLRQPDLELVPRDWMVVEPPDVETLAGALDDDVLALRRTLRDLVDQRKQVDVLGIAKRRAIAEFDRHFIPLARVLEATFRVAGETELADRIRPTVRRLVRNPPGERAPGDRSSAGGEIGASRHRLWSGGSDDPAVYSKVQQNFWR